MPVRNLFHDTLYRRARRAVLDTGHRLDDRLTRLRRPRCRRILFEAASPLSVAIFRPVFDLLRRDPQVDFWLTSSDARWNAHDIFEHTGMTGRVVTPREAYWHKFDLYVNTDFWNMTWLPRRTRRVHMFHGVAGKYDLDAPTRLAPTVATFDRLCFPNRDRLHRYVEAGLVDPDAATAALVGYPKVDCLVDGSLDRTRILETLGLDGGRPTLMYAPTWSPNSSLNEMGDGIIRALVRQGANVIVKLHDRSYDTAVRASGGINWRLHLDRLAREHGIHVAAGADASPYLFVADALITDHSSVAFEYMLLDRPVIVMECPPLARHARISPHKLGLMRDAADTVREVGELPPVLEQVRGEPWRHSERRRAVAAALFFDAGHAARRAAGVFYDVLELAQPAYLTDGVAVAAAAPFHTLKPELLN